MAFILSFYFNLILIIIIFQLIPILIIAKNINSNNNNNNNINLLDKNAFQMNFGKRREEINSLPKWPKMDGNTFRMSFGKRLINNNKEEEKEEILTHSNIAIPLLFDLNGSGLLNSISNESNEKEHSPKFIRKQNWPSRWRASLFRKRLDRNLFNVGFGK